MRQQNCDHFKLKHYFFERLRNEETENQEKKKTSILINSYYSMAQSITGAWDGLC